MKKVLISAFIGSRNLGDEAIFKSILDNLDVDKSQITALSINEAKTQKLGVQTVFAKKVSNTIRAIKDCDVMLVGGGGIIQDQSSILNFLYYAFQLYVARHYKKPVILCFVGIGPLNFGLSKWIMGRIMPSLEYAIVRDTKSAQTLSKYVDDPSLVYQAHDPVLNFPFEPEALPKVELPKTRYVAVSLRRWFFTNPLLPVFVSRKLNKFKIFRKKYEAYMHNLAQDFDTWLERNPDINLVAVSLYDSEDDIVNDDLVALMKHHERVVLAKNDMDEYEFLSVVKGAEFTVGMRLHSLILGANLHKPFVALRYSTKVDEFAEQMGLSDSSIHVERYDSDKLQQSLDTVLANKADIQQDIGQRLGQYQQANQTAFQVLNQKIKQYL